MASKRAKANDDGAGRKIDFALFAADLETRCAQRGDPELPRNVGTTRTPENRALLKAIEDMGGKW